MTLKQIIAANVKNIPGWRSKRRLLVIESDDWGSIRMPSLSVLQNLKTAGLDMESGDSFRYNNYDTLATSEDLSLLFEVLAGYKDISGNSAKFTAVSVVCNPDFEKIKESGFSRFYFEPFTQTLKRYGRESAFSLWKEGIKNNIFVPQFHGREHLNVPSWMRALREGDKHTHLAFAQGCWGFNSDKIVNYQAAFDLEFFEDLREQEEIIESGVDIFEQLHGYRADFFVPPNGPINNKLEEIAARNGIKFISTPKVQHEVFGEGKTKRNFRYLGKKNAFNQRYITRNCFFEPSQSGKDWVDSCLSDISFAFKWNKPAVISSHRVNYIGSLSKENRDRGLNELKRLLSETLKNWTQTEFVTSNELGDIIKIAEVQHQ